jgi:hypothetical protein
VGLTRLCLLTFINAAVGNRWHEGAMLPNHTIQLAPRASAIAQRLLAHARLCEQIALECCNEATAEKLKRMAQECTRAAAQMAPGRDTLPTRH